MKSEVEKRRVQIGLQLDRLRLRLAQKTYGHYASEGTYKYQRTRAALLIVELEDELSMLSFPGDYAELAVATVADELRLTCKQVRDLIKSGEIEATGNAAHERISRVEMERIAGLGAAELIRLGRQEATEIFEEAILYLQDGDLEFSERAYRRLKGRGAWSETYVPTFLLCLEIAKGEFEAACDTIKLIQEWEDPAERTAIVANVQRLLKGMRLDNSNARAFCEQLIMCMTGEEFTRWRPNWSQWEHSNEWAEWLHVRAASLANAVQLEVKRHGFRLIENKPEADVGDQDRKFNLLIRSAIYKVLCAEVTSRNRKQDMIRCDRTP